MKLNDKIWCFYISLFVTIFFSFVTKVHGQNLTKQSALSFSEKLLRDNSVSLTNSYKITNCEKLSVNDSIGFYIFQLDPVGFVMVSNKESNNPVLAYSFENDFSFDSDRLKIVASFVDNRSSDKKISFRNSPTETVGPLIRSLYGQVNCYDENDKLINVSNLFTPHNYAPGCVAISLATLLHYYQWPLTGTGEHEYSDKKGSSQGTYSANFGETEYDWDNILERYRYKNTSLQQREALGELVYHAAVALDMNFEYNGSTSNINRIPNTGKNYFRFIAKQVPASSFIFWKVVDSSLVHKMPVIFSISASNGAGHSIVCDGFKFDNGDEYHHVNMGWWGNSNGWYKIKKGFKVGGYNKINHGLINFIPVPMMLDIEVPTDSTFLEVNWVVSKKVLPDSYELQFKTDTSNWTTVSDTMHTTTYVMNIDKEVKVYSFRVRSKIGGKWFSDSWSNIANYKKISTPVIDNEIEATRFYPNPFSDVLNIDIVGKYKVKILSINGKVLYDRVLFGYSTIPTVGIQKGVYILKIQKGNMSYTTKIVKVN